ncbi:2-oxoglutarate dehydrogenase complex dihydrolipoyllysine-residue succinyltransferase [Pantoea sp. Aalb]|uniref:2-oxoglutarate dehydrogenase complex dihydrolipoyllysine-residue succinyltransferase n=1 Tax=Pantoea sp. Aalb TaxID=2576762 RepID=UPI00132560B2|nr:2-oxoglutarate dehydrogenase complex dihydrolipoyllysine-residue succinyltransferase [Pantoea sp. Aalb]MXP67533.1 2-oxoglutarate dehydrogenase complex dihydrolipoyllysine-residue succinyltransferase [Pantoea sp. Aalb]
MSIVEIFVPDLPESVADATVITWHKKPGDFINRDEVLVELETDKVILEVPAPLEGILENILEKEGAIVNSHQILGYLKKENNDENKTTKTLSDNKSTLVQDKIVLDENKTTKTLSDNKSTLVQDKMVLKTKSNYDFSPAIRRLIAEKDIDINQITGIGISGHIIRDDINEFLIKKTKNDQNNSISLSDELFPQNIANRKEKRVPMTRLRKRVAERLLESKNSTAILTTFNEVNMKPIIDLRKSYGELFEQMHGIRLGFMSFYIKIVTEALKRFPEINAFIDGDDVVYHNYFDISIAISTPRGLVTPVLKNVNAMSMADIENKIKELALKGRNGKLTVEELTGGNFTITNGGIFGSLISTPIINPPQSAILGMHAIKDRPMAVNGEIVILPMMYLALSYDHRLIDGRESVGYLVAVKEMLEDPVRLLLNV